MPGLAPYINILAPGESVDINARGTTVFMRDGGVELEVTVRALQVGGKGGETYTVRMVDAEKWFLPSEFDQVRITNTSVVTTAQIEMYIGYGDFYKPVPDVVQVSAAVPASRTIVTVADKVNIDVGNAGKEKLADIDLDRTRLIITALSSNTDIIRIGDDAVTAARGIPLQAGESVAIDSTDEVYACSEASADQAAAVYYEQI